MPGPSPLSNQTLLPAPRHRRAVPPRLAALLLAALLLAAGARAEAPLGRLFFTPEQRHEIDRQWRQELQSPLPTHDSRLTINGTVRRTSGAGTTWINGTMQHEPRAAGGPPGQVTLRTEARRDVRIKAGQSYDTTSERIHDPLGDGRIQIHRTPPRTP